MTKLQTDESLKTLIADCQFGDWDIVLRYDGPRPYVQILFMDKCEFTGEDALQSCRKWGLSYEMCDSEVVTTVKKAVLSAVEHEALEKFKFRGRRIFNPHRSVHALWELAGKPGSVEVRPQHDTAASTPTSDSPDT